jgi:hypothetical protein
MPLTPELIRLLAVLEDASIKDAREGLEQLRELYSNWLMYSTGAVAVGVFLEAPEIFHDTWEQLSRWRHGYIPAKFDSRTGMPAVEGINWGKVMGAIGWLLIVAGVALEGLFESRVSSLSTDIQHIDLAHVASLDSEVIAAQKSAHDASLEAKAASDRATGAQDRADADARDNTKLKGDLDKANTERRRQVATLEASNLDQKKANLDLEATNLKTESELINLAVCDAPRVIPSWSLIGNGVETSVDPLKPFAGRIAIIDFLPDPEAKRAAFQIARSLSDAKWDVRGPQPLDGLRDGVEIQPYNSGQGSSNFFENIIPAQELADALVNFLHSYNWQALWTFPDRNPELIPPKAIRVRVGLYPAVEYVTPPGSKDLDSALALLQANRDEQRKRQEQQTRANDERLRAEEDKMTQDLPPNARQVVEEQTKAREATRDKKSAERAKSESRYTNPCQPIARRLIP